MVIPGKELVGRNARLEEGIYSDDYLAALNSFASVENVFGPHRQDIAAGKPVVGRLVMDTLGRSEWENHLVSIVMRAAKQGSWAAVPRDPRLHSAGLDAVVEKKFGYVVEKEGKKFLLPSAFYAVYCQAQLEE